VILTNYFIDSFASLFKNCFSLDTFS